jgi:hypothetical protein
MDAVDRSVMSDDSDHWAVVFQVQCAHPLKPKTKLTVRKWKNIDTQQLNHELNAVLS